MCFLLYSFLKKRVDHFDACGDVVLGNKGAVARPVAYAKKNDGTVGTIGGLYELPLGYDTIVIPTECGFGLVIDVAYSDVSFFKPI